MSTRDSTDMLVRVVLLVLAILVLLPLLLMSLAMPMMGMMGWGGMGPGTQFSPLWGLGTTLVVLLVVLGVGYYLVRSVAGKSGGVTDPALEELRLAYARGDLSEEEFERRRERLSRDDRE